MVKVRPSTPEEEAEFAERAKELHEAYEAGETDIPKGDVEELASHIVSGKEVVLSDQVREFLAEEGISQDEFIAMLLKKGKRQN